VGWNVSFIFEFLYLHPYYIRLAAGASWIRERVTARERIVIKTLYMVEWKLKKQEQPSSSSGILFGSLEN
jgi:hypothetical protein